MEVQIDSSSNETDTFGGIQTNNLEPESCDKPGEEPKESSKKIDGNDTVVFKTETNDVKVFSKPNEDVKFEEDKDETIIEESIYNVIMYSDNENESDSKKSGQSRITCYIIYSIIVLGFVGMIIGLAIGFATRIHTPTTITCKLTDSQCEYFNGFCVCNCKWYFRWIDAKNFCETHNTRLTILNSEWKLKFFMNKTYNGWLGAIYSNNSAQWVDGTNVNTTSGIFDNTLDILNSSCLYATRCKDDSDMECVAELKIDFDYCDESKQPICEYRPFG